MKVKFQILFSLLLLISFTSVFGALSDATGLVKRFDIVTGGHIFEVTTTSNYDLQKVDFDKDQKKLTFHMVSSLEKNLGEIIVPRGLVSGNYTFYLNGQDFAPKVKINDKIAFITLNFTGSGNNKLELVASKYLEDQDVVEPGIKEHEKIINEGGGGCLIATATYGSELAPQVQTLREIRDNKILQTKVGTEFMELFNKFYYAFSPQIADLERENYFLKESVKIAITPMLLSLSILNEVEIKSEVDMAIYGTSVIFLNLAMYFTLPTLIAFGLIDKRKNPKLE